MERTDRLLQEMESIKSELASDSVEFQGLYKLAASHLLCRELLVPAWNSLQKENPKIQGELYTLRSADVLKGVLDGSYDLGICFAPQAHP